MPPLFLALMKLPSLVKESVESFPANRILKCVLFECLNHNNDLQIL